MSDFVLGVVLISGALCADAVIGNVQEKSMKRYHASNAEMVCVIYYLPIYLICYQLDSPVQKAN